MNALRWLRFTVLLVLALPAAALQEAPAAERRAAILELAERFASVRWKAEARHAFHGEDENGVRIDTPDVQLDEAGWKPGEENVGMPYCWGGFTSLEGFEGELAEERWAGHVPQVGNAMGSRKTIGVDCSGLVSRCWNLPLKQSTRSLGALCYELDDYGQLQPGDIVNRFDSHVALFTEWANEERTEMRVIEAARLRVEESVYTLEELRTLDFRPMRYKLLDERWRPMPMPDPERDAVVAAGARRRFVMGPGGSASVDPIPAAVRAGEVNAGDWVRYATVEAPRLTGDDVRCTWMAVAGAPGKLELQRRLAVGKDSIATGATLDSAAPWHELLAAFGAFSNPQRDMTLVVRSVDDGTYRLGELELPARRVTGVVEGHMLSRSTLYPAVLEIECVVSDDVPLLGLCEASLTLEVDYGEYGKGRSEHRYELTAFGRG